MRKKSAQPNQSLIDGIATLQALATSQEPIGGRELARRLGFEPTRVNRLLKTLAYLGIARQTANRKYTAGPGMHVLAAQSLFASGIIHRALPVLESLRRYNHVIALGVLWRDNVSYLYHAPPGLPSVEALGRIGLYPATRGGIGLALLAEHDDHYVSELYADSDIPNFPEGIDSLLRTLHEIREQHYVRINVKAEQHTVAVTVGDPPHSAIGMSGWIPPESTTSIVEILRDAAQRIGHDTEVAPSSEPQVLADLNRIRTSV
ncbi:helix-turn-helix domain-containing protein [Exilibacterium tricleocarpae]|uniref:Helix-turn-helix domain-containing protein n=1 Tax=Exilibacterium tricleocarpae TaxID=2591008 RepID=A0A545T005_9GAMM|nr:helix-turn-helix domain-containing protein [Exilibacterium tricleocarpae]TQV70548.1 helix-turn-helix domain-containing protein [Exilibacterium tricleocarpae]